jgi:hypothetical protein
MNWRAEVYFNKTNREQNRCHYRFAGRKIRSQPVGWTCMFQTLPTLALMLAQQWCFYCWSQKIRECRERERDVSSVLMFILTFKKIDKLVCMCVCVCVLLTSVCASENARTDSRNPSTGLRTKLLFITKWRYHEETPCYERFAFHKFIRKSFLPNSKIIFS